MISLENFDKYIYNESWQFLNNFETLQFSYSQWIPALEGS